MPGYEPGEMVTLALMLIALGVTVGSWRQARAWRFARLAVAWFALWLVATVLTVAEHFAWHDPLNAIEHTCHVVAAVLALLAVRDFVELRRERVP